MNRQAKGALLTAGGGVCWGLSGSMGQFLFSNEGMDARWLTPVRLGGAAILLLLYSFFRYGISYTVEPWRDRKMRRDLVIYGLLGVSCCQFLYFETIQLSSAAAGTILQDLSPAMILFVGCIAAKRRPAPREIAAILVGLLGVFFITTGGRLDQMAVPATALATGVLSAVCVTIYNVVPARRLKKYPVILLQGWAFLMGSVAMTVIFRPWQYFVPIRPMGYVGILTVIVVGNVFAFTLYMSGIRDIGPDKGILYGFAEPMTAAVVGVFVFGNAFTAADFAGFALVFFMLYLISRREKNHTRSSQVTRRVSSYTQEKKLAS
ncbi:MAG: DMT family transporter [Lachnospiraceae bacterium]